MPKYRLYLICIFLYVDRMVSILSHIWKIGTQFCLSVYILENMEQGKSIFQHISHSDKQTNARNSNENSNFDESYSPFNY